MGYRSELTKQELLELIVDSYKKEYELRDNAICGDDGEIMIRCDNRYQVIKELFNNAKIYVLMEGK